MFIRLASVQYKSSIDRPRRSSGKIQKWCCSNKKKKERKNKKNVIFSRGLAPRRKRADCKNNLNTEEANYIIKCNHSAVIDIDEINCSELGMKFRMTTKPTSFPFFLRNIDNRSKGFQRWDRFANGLAENAREA